MEKNQRHLEEKEHFRRKAEACGHSWWGQATIAGRGRLKRKQRILSDFLMKGNLKTVILEIGCGAGELTSSVKKHIRVVGMDLSLDLLRFAKEANKGVEYIQADALAIPFEDQTFDFVVGDGILHHLDLIAALNEIKRVLKDNGSILFFEPNMLNPQIFLERKISFIRKINQTQNETAFYRWNLKNILKRDWQNAEVKSFDFLHPATPKCLISIVECIGFGLEKVPLIKEFAGSIYIEAEKRKI